MTIREEENYLFKVVEATLKHFDLEATKEEIADLVMLTLLNIKK